MPIWSFLLLPMLKILAFLIFLCKLIHFGIICSIECSEIFCNIQILTVTFDSFNLFLLNYVIFFFVSLWLLYTLLHNHTILSLLRSWSCQRTRPNLHRSGCGGYFADLLAVLSNRYQLCPTARHLAVYLLDLFMDHYDVAVRQLYVIALSCLLLASKSQMNLIGLSFAYLYLIR